eukprot:PRCOL_00001166-RA
MNVLTQIRNRQRDTLAEVARGVPDSASWHAEFADSAYVFVGGLAYGLTEGDVLAVMSQFGEVVDVQLARDEETGKSKGFAHVAYDDQRSTVLAVDNLSGATVAGRVVNVDHVKEFRRKVPKPAEGEEGDEGKGDRGGADARAGPAALPPPPPPARGAGGAGDDAPVVVDLGEQAAAVAEGARAGSRGGGGSMPWAGSGSMFDVLGGAGGPGKSEEEEALERRRREGHGEGREHRREREREDEGERR